MITYFDFFFHQCFGNIEMIAFGETFQARYVPEGKHSMGKVEFHFVISIISYKIYI